MLKNTRLTFWGLAPIIRTGYEPKIDQQVNKNLDSKLPREKLAGIKKAREVKIAEPRVKPRKEYLEKIEKKKSSVSHS